MRRSDDFEQAKVKARASFALAAFWLGVALLTLLDRVGMPERLVGWLALIAALAGLTVIAILLRTMRISRFYAGGRLMPASFGGLAAASLAFALAWPFLPAPETRKVLDMLAGLGCGIAGAGLVMGPLLRRTGAFSISDLLTVRFPDLSLRLCVVAVTALIAGLIGIAGFETALQGLTAFSGFPRPINAAVVAALLILMIVPGGASGIVWAAAAAACILLTAFATPLAMLTLGSFAKVSGVLTSEAFWSSTLPQLGLASGEQRADFFLILTIAAGISALAPYLLPSVACFERRDSQKAGLISLFWTFLLVAFLILTVGLSLQALQSETIGKRADRLSDEIYAASGKGLVTICGAHPATPIAAREACAPVLGASPAVGAALALRAGDVSALNSYLFKSLAELRDLGNITAGLIAAGLVATGLVLAAAGIQSFTTALANDAFYRMRDHTALTSRRLAIARAVAVLFIIGSAAFLSSGAIDPRMVIAVALGLSAAVLAPLLVLTLWPRATSLDALVTVIAGPLAVTIFIFLENPVRDIDLLTTSVVLAGSTSLFAGILTSLMHKPDEERGRSFIRAILYGHDELLHPDKGV
jgi:cation/acetate symporter